MKKTNHTDKNGSRYFHQRDLIRPLSAGLLVASILIAWLPLSWVAYILAGIVAPVSLVMFFVAGARTVSDGDIAEQIEAAMRDYDKAITDMNGYDRVVLRQPAPVESKAYSFGADAALFKKGKNNTPVSDCYVGTHFFFTGEALLVIGRRLSVTELGGEGGGMVDFSETIPYATIRSAVLEEHNDMVKLTNTGKNCIIRWSELVITSSAPEGGELLRLPVRNDMDMAGLCEALNR